jgi:hypothetical protein
MNTKEIDAVMKRTPAYRGTFSRDTIPDVTGLMIVNTDPRHLPGTHWIAIFIDPTRQRGEYFDSFGRPPDEHFATYMNTHCTNWIYNRRQLQSVVSKFCGYYCIVYCVLRSAGRDMNSFVKTFSRDTGYNDVLIKKCLSLIVGRLACNNATLKKFIR